jgi:hypothetical protein
VLDERAAAMCALRAGVTAIYTGSQFLPSHRNDRPLGSIPYSFDFASHRRSGERMGLLRAAARHAKVGVLFSSLACWMACSDDPLPAEVESGFEFEHDAFSFANFARDDQGFALDADSAARMCGKKLVCQNDALPCVPTQTAAGWIEGVNQTLYEGRSEGFAVLAQLLSLGKLDPNDFGAKTAAELALTGNPKLQAELAYWAATQSVPSALEGDKKLSAKNVMPFLAFEM